MKKRMLIGMIMCLYLGLYEGHLALTDGEDFHHIFPYRAELYTDADRVLLEKGIPLPDRQRLSVVLEDYFS